MTLDARINFKNLTSKPITIKPIKSSAGRWKAFTLRPGDSVQTIRDSNGGAGNYDIEFSVTVNPKGEKNDELIGKFRANNPFIGNFYLQSLSKEVWYGRSLKKDPIIQGGKMYTFEYFFDEKKIEPNSLGKKGVFGAINESALKSITTFEGPTLEVGSDVTRYYSEKENGAFFPEIPFAKVEYLGEANSTKEWNFFIDNF